MIKIVAVLVCFFIFMANVCAVSPETNKIEEQIISLESSNFEYNLGWLQTNKIIKKTIKIRNKLNQNFKIKEARSTCECMEIKVVPQLVERNGTFEIEIIFDTSGIGGERENIVYILTDNMKYEIIHLKILSKISE